MIPVSTHRITVERLEDPSNVDPWEQSNVAASVVVAEHVRAVISVPGGKDAGRGGTGDSEDVDYILLCDPCDLDYLDTVTDEASGQRYAVTWAVASPGIAGLASVKAGLSTHRGFGQKAG